MQDEIQIVTFEPQFQPQSLLLFQEGLVKSYAHKGNTLKAVQQWFVDNKTGDGGDLRDIWASYISPADSCRHFFVALHNDRVIGQVGVIPSTYAPGDTDIYDKASHTPETVCELVRMSVNDSYRGKGVGKRLCSAVENYARSCGMSKIALSTLVEMELARALYERCGYTVVYEKYIPIERLTDMIGPGDWEPLGVVHYSKVLSS
jgi:GNAT superfamily N-acetyltransferase